MSWADLPPDLLRLISGSFLDAGDFLRLHAVWQSWRDAAPASHPQFLPWLLAPGGQNPPSIARFRSVFSNTSWRAPGKYGLRNRWLAAAGAWLLTCDDAAGPPPPPLRLVDPFTGAATALPPFALHTEEYIPYGDGFVLADGTVVMFAMEDYFYSKYDCRILAAVLRPGDTAWREGQALLLKYKGFGESWAAAYHKGEIVLIDETDTVKLRVIGDDGDALDLTLTSSSAPPWDRSPERFPRHGHGHQPQPRPHPQGIYAFDSRGELLAACLLLDTPAEQDAAAGDDPRALAGAMSVWIYALDEPGAEDGGDRQRWVARDARSLLRDRVVFLGCPASFAVDATRFAAGGGVSGGCAYFSFNSRRAGSAWRKVPEACRVYRYSFEDGGATVVEELPAGAGSDDTLMTWVTPRLAAIAPAREIRERILQDSDKKQGAPCPRSIIRAPRTVFGAPFTIFVGNLPPWMSSLKLEQFFAGYGKVTDARVIYERGGYTSLDFGVVTMAALDDPANIFAALHGEHFFGHALQVKFTEERPKGPFIMPLLAPKAAQAQTLGSPARM